MREIPSAPKTMKIVRILSEETHGGELRAPVGSGTSVQAVSKCAERKFESISLQRRVGRNRGSAGSPTGSTETRRVFPISRQLAAISLSVHIWITGGQQDRYIARGEAFAALLAPTAYPLVSESRIG